MDCVHQRPSHGRAFRKHPSRQHRFVCRCRSGFHFLRSYHSFGAGGRYQLPAQLESSTLSEFMPLDIESIREAASAERIHYFPVIGFDHDGSCSSYCFRRASRLQSSSRTSKRPASGDSDVTGCQNRNRVSIVLSCCDCLLSPPAFRSSLLP